MFGEHEAGTGQCGGHGTVHERRVLVAMQDHWTKVANDGRNLPAQRWVEPGPTSERNDRDSFANQLRRPLSFVIQTAHD
jgi:hypothetical protein